MIAQLVSEFLFHGFCEHNAKYKWGYRILKRMAIRSYLRAVDIWNDGHLVDLGKSSSTPATQIKAEI